MTIQIKAGIIHQIKKQKNSPSANAVLHLQKTLHSTNNHLSTFVAMPSNNYKNQEKITLLVVDLVSKILYLKY
ncbi:hypothetical protein AP460_02723 [Actinobacillus pleuropneumoniae]|nr:hypothetical protein AP1022_02738 [Actinobacillus pleuropneumoniae]KIE92063.1 hypothetical protein AP460_02723 [Actinobacillus pleuropneumoniae]KIE97195.1 hypothetical protein AP5651_02839 [Actinobacillus pleuropneumoniae]KIE98167.1 hypothetical protein AP780_02790 [Actinobacillus pleuropneumoniae]